MPVITIRGQLGSWTTEIGELIAHKLNIDYIDREIIAGVAKGLGRPSVSVEEKEKLPTTLFERISEILSKAAYAGDATYPGIYTPVWEIPLGDRDYLTGLTSFIREMAKSRAIVIRGRGSQFILKDFPGAFHVLIVAPLEVRLKRVMEAMHLDEDNAKNEIARFDDSSREFVKRYFQADITAPENYDLVVNTHHLGIEDATSLVVSAVNRLTDKGENAK